MAWRALLRTPGYTVVAVTSLTLGFALAGTTLSVVRSYLARSMPYPSADRLHHVQYAPVGQEEPENMEGIDWALLRDVVDAADASAPARLYIGSGMNRQELYGVRLSVGSLDLVALDAAAGRVLTNDDFQPGSEPVVLIGHSLWRSRFGADPDMIGRTIEVASAAGGEPAMLRIAGILQPGFRYAREHARGAIDFVLPQREPWPSYMVRLRSGVPVSIAEQRITDAARRAATSLPSGWTGVRLESIHDRYLSGIRPVFSAIAVTAALALVSVTVTLAVLNLLRVLRRQGEMAVRIALGAGPGRIARLLVAEAGLLCSAGLANGLVLTMVSLRLLAPVIERRLGREAPGGPAAIAVDPAVLLWLAGIGLVMAFGTSLIPAFMPWRRRLVDALRRSGRAGTESRSLRRTRSVLIAIEVGAAVALLTGGGLMVRSVINLVRTDLGYTTDGIARVRIALPEQPGDGAASGLDFYDRLSERLTGLSIPHALTDFIPFYEYPARRVLVDENDRTAVEAGVMVVSDGWYDLMAIPLRSGRAFTPDDRPGSEPVAMVSESMARRLRSDGQAVGRRIRVTDGDDTWRTIVGITADVRQTFTDRTLQDVYIPFSQAAVRYAPLYLRTDPAHASLMTTLRTIIADIDPDVLVTDGVTGANSLAEEQARALAGPRFLMAILTGLAAFATFLALIGVYGVSADAVRQRDREVAIRMAIGATRSTIVGVFARDGAMVVGGGVVIGLLSGALTARLLEQQLHGIQPLDPITFALACTAMALAGLVATCWPAVRASARNPLASLNDS